MSTLEAWQQRVVDEKNELDVRIGKLRSFLQSDSYVNMPSGRAKGLLVEQLSAMEEYSNILSKRIQLF